MGSKVVAVSPSISECGFSFPASDAWVSFSHVLIESWLLQTFDEEKTCNSDKHCLFEGCQTLWEIGSLVLEERTGTVLAAECKSLYSRGFG